MSFIYILNIFFISVFFYLWRAFFPLHLFVCATFLIYHKIVVVTQFYITEAENEYVIKGNAAVMKCKIPSFVADFVQVEAWINAEDGTVLTHSNDSSSYGYFHSKFFFLPQNISFYHLFLWICKEKNEVSPCCCYQLKMTQYRQFFFRTFVFNFIFHIMRFFPLSLSLTHWSISWWYIEADFHGILTLLP